MFRVKPMQGTSKQLADLMRKTGNTKAADAVEKRGLPEKIVTSEDMFRVAKMTLTMFSPVVCDKFIADKGVVMMWWDDSNI